MIGPADIERVQFSTTRLKEGYDQDQVDSFLDRVADSLRKELEGRVTAEAEASRLRTRYEELKRQHDAYTDAPTSVVPVPPEPTAMAGRLLELAQQTADEVTARAQAEAVDIQRRAEESARETIAEGVREAEQRRRAAESEAYASEQKLIAVKAAERRQHDFLNTIAAEVTAVAQKLEG